LRCGYCDTAYAFSGGENFSVKQILKQIEPYKTKYITVTGGEPLAQKDCIELLTALCDRGYTVSLETSGALSVADVDSRVVKIVDIKTPGSLESAKNDFNNIQYISSQDQVKFVITSYEDYEWSKKIMRQFELSKKCHVLFSPSYQQVSYADLAQWILKDQLPVRMQVQLHKVIWGDVKGK